jgi:hypothetical protein
MTNSTQARLAEAKTRIIGEIFITILRSFNLAFKTLIMPFFNLSTQLESLQSAAEYAAGFVNA